MFAAMAALGAVFSLRLMRIGGLARLTLSGIALGFIIFFFNQLCGAMGKAEIIPIFLAAWATPVVALLSAMTLLVYTEDG
jgi:lipopolysaccharide export system permease protein